MLFKHTETEGTGSWKVNKMSCGFLVKYSASIGTSRKGPHTSSSGSIRVYGVFPGSGETIRQMKCAPSSRQRQKAEVRGTPSLKQSKQVDVDLLLYSPMEFLEQDIQEVRDRFNIQVPKEYLKYARKYPGHVKLNTFHPEYDDIAWEQIDEVSI